MQNASYMIIAGCLVPTFMNFNTPKFFRRQSNTVDSQIRIFRTDTLTNSSAELPNNSTGLTIDITNN
jgi:hypothetical protein